MRLFPPHFACPALSRYIVRRTPTRSKFVCTPSRPHHLPFRAYCDQSLTGAVDDDMGKDDKSTKNFNLKVPKGTRDCRPDPPVLMRLTCVYMWSLTSYE
jgi:histidyl-tRNA synthetase